MTLKERAILAKRMLSKQKPVSYEEAKAQVARLKAQSTSNNNKKGFNNTDLPLDKN